MRKIATNADLMTTREAGDKLGVAVRTVQLWVEAGVLPAWRTAGGHRRIARGAVDALLAERAQVLESAPSKLATTHARAALRLMVVEDDPITLRLTTQVINAWKLPLHLTTATNGFEALIRMGQLCPDVLITDLQMPGVDGFQMLHMLKRPGSDYAYLHVVVISALTAQEVADHGGLPDGVAFLSKPVHYGELQALVRQYVAAANPLEKSIA